MNKLLLLPAFLFLFQASLNAQWASLNGPYGGYVEELEANQDYVFANKPNGLFRSADAGLNWERCDTASYYSTAIHQQNLLRRAGPLQPFRFRYSPDNGDHWQEIPLPSQVDFSFNFAVKGSVIVFTYYNTLYRSDDLGQNWHTFQINSEPFHFYSFLKTIGNRIYLGNRTRLLYSEDGLNWNFLSAVHGSQDAHFASLYQKDSLILAQIGQTVWRSSDGGSTWGQTISPSMGGFNGWPVDFVGINDTLFASTGRKLLRSFDNGLTWIFANPNGSSFDNLTSFGSVLLGGAIPYGVNVSTDHGQNFQPSNYLLQGGDVWALALKNNDLWVWENEGISKLNATQIEWTTPILHKPYWGTLPGSRIYPTQGAIFALENFGFVLRTFDEGQSWDTISPFTATENAKIEKAGDTLFLLNAFIWLYQSTDLGDQWEYVSPIINPQIDASVRDLTIQSGKVFFTNWKTIFRSDDHLQNWQLAGDSLPFGQSTEVIRLFSTPNFLFALVNEKQLYISQDYGETWSLSSFPMADFIIGGDFKVQFAEIGNTLLGLFEWNGIFKSNDSGQTWQYFHEGLPNPIHVTEFVFNDSTLWLGSREFGLFKRPISDLSTVSTAQPLFTQNALKIFPNPTQGTFSCILPKEISGEANITAYDLQGRQLMHRTASTSNLPEIDLGVFGPGMYWIKIVATHGVFGGKVVIE